MSWDLFVYEPRKCYHPALYDLEEPGNWFPAIIVEASPGNVVVFNLNYLIISADGSPSSGHAYTPYEGVRLLFHDDTNEWLMFEGDRTFRFALAEQDVLSLFRDNRDQIPSPEAMQEKAIEQFLD